MKDCWFEKVSRFKDDEGFNLPVRKTYSSAGYDMEVAEDIVIYPYASLTDKLGDPDLMPVAMTLSDVNAFTKRFGARPSLVSSGVKCHLAPGTYLELSVRSSTPLKYWLILANGVGIIDKDYYNNPDNEGEIFFQLINLSPYPIQLKKGDIIGQGIIKSYLTTDDDHPVEGDRVGGFGSTSK